MNRRVLLVGAALVVAAIAYLFGSQQSGAQTSSIGVGSIWEGNATYVSGGVLHVTRLNDQTGTEATMVSLPLPRSGDIADVCARNNGGGGISVAWLLYADGSLYEYTQGTGWLQIGDLASGGATAIQGISWGRMKDRYRK